MANLYESSSYNILSVYKSSGETINSYLIKIQRLPISFYPDITEIVLTTEQIDPNLALSDWVAQAIPLIDSEISTYDSEFTGDSSYETDIEQYNYSQIFV